MCEVVLCAVCCWLAIGGLGLAGMQGAVAGDHCGQPFNSHRQLLSGCHFSRVAAQCLR
jgi:hypothetical protein